MNKYITGWLVLACTLILSMVVIGGITRLTHSGLSMVKWEVVTGIIPPLSNDDWVNEFELYKKFPEYQKINRSMTLSEFKSIYYWEYFHRLTGRFIGIVFILPLIFFLYKKWIPIPLFKRLGVMFGLGLLQGFMGWYMVKSGLVDNPNVSHYRLAIHFMLAVGLIGYIYWTILDFTKQKPLLNTTRINRWKLFGLTFLLLIMIQMVWGAFTAGLKAGFAWNTFPKMNGEWIPSGLFILSPFWNNFFENNMMVQFVHRLLGILIFTYSIVFWILFKNHISHDQKQTGNYVLIITVIQVGLGIVTLLLHIPVWMAVSHQLMAALLFLGVLKVNWIIFNSSSDIN